MALRQNQNRLTVAHRLSTIIDYDTIAVLGAGELLEIGAPAELVRRPGGAFASLWQESQQQHRRAGAPAD